LDIFDEYHELVNPFVMNKEIKKKVYFDELDKVVEKSNQTVKSNLELFDH